MGLSQLPLYARVLLGVFLGAVVGSLSGTGPIVAGITAEDLGRLGMLVIRLLKLLAVPLVLFAILDAFARTAISLKMAGRLGLICLVNVSIAMLIGLALMNGLEPGLSWRNHLTDLATAVGATAGSGPKAVEGATLAPLANIDRYIPESLVEPFLKNNIISVVLAGLLFGAAFRRAKHHASEAVLADNSASLTAAGESVEMQGLATLERLIAAVLAVLIQALEWVVKLIPFAVFGVLAQVVGKSGLGIFMHLWTFLWVILLGMALHALIYYPLVAWGVGRKAPRIYLGKGADAIFTGLSTNSSLATVPITLKCLTQRMGVSERSARMAACIGTNLNNDGITLYEAMATLFLAQACGIDLSLSQQLVVVAASIMAGVGVAGIPEAGLVVLPMVLAAAGFPDAAIALALPLIMPVDWIIARCRSGVNVMSDMLVAILLDRLEGDQASESGR